MYFAIKIFLIKNQVGRTKYSKSLKNGKDDGYKMTNDSSLVVSKEGLNQNIVCLLCTEAEKLSLVIYVCGKSYLLL